MSVRLTVAQAIVRFLEVQYVERDGLETPFFAGCWGIFGHGNVAGVGQALLEREHAANDGEAGAPGHVLRYHQARNEQAMVHAAVGYARHRDRMATYAVTASVGPGSTNLVTGAALATINRIPVLLLPGDIVLVPFGYHGPSMAAPGYDLYYLNVMAGPEAERAWKISDDPAHGWIREIWADQAVDSRLPFDGRAAAAKPRGSAQQATRQKKGGE